MDENELKERTKKFALAIIKLVESLPKTITGRAIVGQLVRCGTSVGANYRSACRGRSRAEFIAKLGIVAEEADESAFWLEILIDSGIMKPEELKPLYKEADEFTAIFTSSIKSAKRRGNNK